MNIAILYGSNRTERQGIKAAKFIKNKLQERNHEVNIIDSKEYELPFLDKMYKEYEQGKAPRNIEIIHQILENSDGFVIVSAEYNHGIPAALKNILDTFQKEFFFKPSAIVSYSAGTFGGVRMASHLREVVAELGMPSISSTFPISKVHESFNENGEALDKLYNKRIKRFIDEFEWYLNALKNQRKIGIPY